jgi:DNA-binding PadR family transcriptional regulator
MSASPPQELTFRQAPCLARARVRVRSGGSIFRISPGMLCPLLHALQRKGYLKSRLQGVGRRARRLYRATKKGHTALHFAKDRVHELFGELFEGRRSGPKT